MSDGNRQRPAIDLDDLERQLRAVAQPKPAPRPSSVEPDLSALKAPFTVKPVFAQRAPEAPNRTEAPTPAQPTSFTEAPARSEAPRLPDNESFSAFESAPSVAPKPVTAPPSPSASLPPSPSLPPLPSAPADEAASFGRPASRASDYDPLAELARIAQSGSDWTQSRPGEAQPQSPSRSHSAVDALEALLRMDPPVKAPPPSFAPPPRRAEPSVPLYEPEQPALDFSSAPQSAPEPVAAYADLAATPSYQAAAAEAEPIYAPEGQLPPHDSHFVDEEPPPRSRTGTKLAIALVSIAALSAGGVFIWGGGQTLTGGDGSRTPPLIKASNEPTKVAPQNPGGMEVPNTNKEIFTSAKNGAPATGPSKVVTTEEQPVDVAQATRTAQPRVILPNGGSAATVPPAPPPPVSTLPRQTGSAPAQTGAAAPSAAPSDTNASAVAALGEPKRVRTVSVRPDGTVIDGNEPAARPPAMAAPASVSPASPVPTQTLPAAAAAPPAAGAPPPALVLPSAPSASTQAGAAPAPDMAAQPAPAGTPVPPRRPSAAQLAAAPAAENTAVPLRPAAPAPANAPAPVAAAPAANAAPVAPVGTGDFAVQLAAPPTEQEARTLAARLVQRYGDALAGQEPDIIRAEVNGRTLYRVRVTGLDRESANAMCNRVKGLQGSCFVAKN
jgi:SPOR domain